MYVNYGPGACAGSMLGRSTISDRLVWLWHSDPTSPGGEWRIRIEHWPDCPAFAGRTPGMTQAERHGVELADAKLGGGKIRWRPPAEPAEPAVLADRAANT